MAQCASVETRRDETREAAQPPWLACNSEYAISAAQEQQERSRLIIILTCHGTVGRNARHPRVCITRYRSAGAFMSQAVLHAGFCSPRSSEEGMGPGGPETPLWGRGGGGGALFAA
jgi:hypothetical protein